MKLEKVVEIKNLNKKFGNLQVLKNINFHLNKGENLVILGKSGVGKSVLLKCIVRLLEPDSGEIIVLGKNIHKLTEIELNKLRIKVGYLFQGSALYDSMTLKENLLFPLKRNFNKLTREEMEGRIENSLRDVGLLDAVNKMPAELSGGMKKRAGLARTLILNPDIILYDEPTTGLDPGTSHGIIELILEIQQNYKTSSIIVTHDMKCA
ncbi:MAG: ATP-binding cassette domain-containing protein, partial [Bacteroidales bacterium]|nr:ATP-binding cassette domain-containing protein [Bacteroidales bacterium]